MGRPSKTRRLDVWMNGEYVGAWTLNAQNRHEFTYAQGWLASPAARPISLSLPLPPSEVPERSARVEAFFDNLLPENAEARRRAQQSFGARSIAAFDLLSEIGRDCAGAIQLCPAGEPPQQIKSIQGRPLDEEGVAAVLRRALTPGTPSWQREEEDAFRISVAGAQEKTALLWHEGGWQLPLGATPSTHLFKLPLGTVGGGLDLSGSVENEWLCGQIAREFDLPTAPCEILQFEEHKVLVVERFDRRLSRDGLWWIRLPQEDMCQALAVPAAHKYESDGGPGIRQIMALLLASEAPLLDRRNFIKSQLLFWLLAAPDGHAKNFSIFMEPRGHYRLTPLYDILSAYPVLGHGAGQLAPEKLKLAMPVWGKSRHDRWGRILPRHWRQTARDCGLGNEIEPLIAEMAELAPLVAERVRSKLPAAFPAAVAEPILQGLIGAAQKLARMA